MVFGEDGGLAENDGSASSELNRLVCSGVGFGDLGTVSSEIIISSFELMVDLSVDCFGEEKLKTDRNYYSKLGETATSRIPIKWELNQVYGDVKVELIASYSIVIELEQRCNSMEVKKENEVNKEVPCSMKNTQ